MPLNVKIGAIACAASLLLVSSIAAEETQGIVKSKPAAGPYVEIDGGFMVPYEFTIPGTPTKLAMVPIPGGTHVMGTGDAAYNVVIEPFWMAQTETTWAQYQEYMKLHNQFRQFNATGIRRVTAENKIDAVTAPTPIYEISAIYEEGKVDPQQAVVTVTQYAAMQFSKWLSGVTGRQYRLPSEAEWEHAALGGTAGPYSFADVDKIGDYAWFASKTGDVQPRVGQKLPNPFGLYDMHGGVWEWVLDAYRETPPEAWAGKTLTADEAIQWSAEPYPLCTKGGSWNDAADDCKVTAKLGSNDLDWKDQEANIPQSPCWFTSYPAHCVGFRVMCPLRTVPKADMAKYWEARSEDLKQDVYDQIRGGRGVEGLVDETLPDAIERTKQK
ncbi:formylglycine-generating enzyme family protein [Blastopirellula marina]|uniref:Transcriptional regulator n=2 Tax=Blastopirellula marina TaxID=124 RepID=A0A2S8GG55_9BACT|nr:transcriptional regulator [Blastopirellula marina]PTL46756.1 formylglycine-generating enzyme family protein [Blastopirellula marina]